MRLLLVNSVCGIGSTGRICLDIAKEYENQGYEVKIAYGRINQVPDEAEKYAVRIGNTLDMIVHGAKSRLFDAHGLGSKRATTAFLKWADTYDPDILWLHNIHGYYINYELLFDWIKSKPNMEVKWTFHDCWAFTGHCVHFSYAKCEKWQSACRNCPQKTQYPKCLLFDRSYRNYLRKREAFSGVNKLTIYTPSRWMKSLINQSFLKEYDVIVSNNTADANVFRHVKSKFKSEMGIEGKKVILGVSSVWTERKGLNTFIELSKLINDQYVIVLVGVDKHTASRIPSSIITLDHIDSQNKLAEIYSAADVFLNPSTEESFGMTTLEAKLCGTRVVALKNTPAEEIIDSASGVLVDNDIDSILNAIVKGNDKVETIW